MSTLIGYRRFKSRKNNKEYCVANVLSSYNDREIENGCAGEKVDEIFLPDKFLNTLQPSDIGSPIRFDYEVSGGRAYIIDLSIG